MAGLPIEGRGRTLGANAFPDDEGTADDRVRQVVAAAAEGRIPVEAAARALRGARLLAAVSAVLDGLDDSGSEKDSHMAVVSMVNEHGERGLLAFTGTDSLAAWNALEAGGAAARPVPVLGRDLARAARSDGAQAVVVDVTGPARLALAGAGLDVLADELDLARVSALVHAALAGLVADGWADVEVRDGRPEGSAVDVLVVVSASGGGHPDGRHVEDVARHAARTLSQRADLQGLVPGGIGVVVGQ